MCKSNIQGESGIEALVSLESEGVCELIAASEFIACRMPAVERQPDFNWLIQVQVEDLGTDATDLILKAKKIYCQSGTQNGLSAYQFSHVRFLGAQDNVVKFGATILSHVIKLN